MLLRSKALTTRKRYASVGCAVGAVALLLLAGGCGGSGSASGPTASSLPAGGSGSSTSESSAAAPPTTAATLPADVASAVAAADPGHLLAPIRSCFDKKMPVSIARRLMGDPRNMAGLVQGAAYSCGLHLGVTTDPNTGISRLRSL